MLIDLTRSMLRLLSEDVPSTCRATKRHEAPVLGDEGLTRGATTIRPRERALPGNRRQPRAECAVTGASRRRLPRLLPARRSAQGSHLGVPTSAFTPARRSLRVREDPGAWPRHRRVELAR